MWPLQLTHMPGCYHPACIALGATPFKALQQELEIQAAQAWQHTCRHSTLAAPSLRKTSDEAVGTVSG